jgi:hypothetical protein
MDILMGFSPILAISSKMTFFGIFHTFLTKFKKKIQKFKNITKYIIKKLKKLTKVKKN